MTTFEPAYTLRDATRAALAGDTQAAAWLRVVAPDLAEDEGRLRQWLEQEEQEDRYRFALLDGWEGENPFHLEQEDLDESLRIAGELDHYQETIHELAFNYPD